MNTKNINMEELVKQFNKEYEFLYEAGKVPGYDAALQKGNYFIANNAEFMEEFVKHNGDLITSDREVVALVFALEKQNLQLIVRHAAELTMLASSLLEDVSDSSSLADAEAKMKKFYQDVTALMLHEENTPKNMDIMSVIDTLKEMQVDTAKCNGFFAGHVAQIWVINDLLGKKIKELGGTPYSVKNGKFTYEEE